MTGLLGAVSPLHLCQLIIWCTSATLGHRPCQSWRKLFRNKVTVETMLGEKAHENGNLCHYQESEEWRKHQWPALTELQKDGPDPSSNHLCSNCRWRGQQPPNIKALATAHGASVSTIQAVLHQDLVLEKKCARWVWKLLWDKQRQQPDKICTKFGVTTIHCSFLSILDFIVTVEKTMFN